MSRLRVTGTALAAAGGLALILVGVPWALTMLAGSPIPSSLPTWTQVTTALRHPDDGTLLVGVLKYVGWAAWLSFTGSVLTQLVAQLRRVRAPRTPLLIAGPVAARLVAAVLAAGTISAASAASAAGPPAAIAAPDTGPAGTGPVPAAPAHAAASTAGGSPVVVTEQVPHVVTVARGDTLSGIAHREYDNASRWPELFEANRGAPQGAGQQLTNPHRIYPGLRVTVPGKTDSITRAVEPTPAPASAAPQADPADDTPAPPAAASPLATLDPSPAPTPTSAPSATTNQTSAAMGGEHHVDEGLEPATVVRTVAGLGSLAAAGALALLARRRARQSRTRRPGQRINLPTGPAAIAEAQLRAASDPITVAILDRALRTLAHTAADTGSVLPALRAARITTDSIELYLVDEHAALPDPATPVPGDPGAWTLTRATLDSQLLDEHTAGEVPAPYPTLVTLGHDEHHAHLLVHLEELRSLAVTGRRAGPVLTAITLELIACQWADDVTITLVGVLPDLADAIGSDRVSYVDDLERILTALEYAAGVRTQAMSDAGVDTPHAARAAGMHPDTWTPHLVITGETPTGPHRQRIQRLLDMQPRTAFAAVIHGEPLGEWQLVIDDPPRAVLHPVRVELTPQHLDEADLHAVLDAFRAADAEHTPGPSWSDGITTEPGLDQIPTPAAMHPLTDGEPAEEQASVLDEEDGDHPDEDLSTGQPQGDSYDDEPPVSRPGGDGGAGHLRPRTVLPNDRPVLRLLGPVRVEHAPGKMPDSPGTALKILTHLALHPGGGHEELDQAVWRGQDKRSTTRAPAISATRTWLGTAADGHPYVAIHTVDGGYRLADDMCVDWLILQELIGVDIADAPTQHLVDALGLVYGKPLSGPRITDTPAEAEIIATISDVAHELAVRALTAGDPTLAAWAAGKGLDVEPVREVLWRDLLRAAHQAGDPDRVRDIITQLETVMDPVGGDLEPDTDQLIDQLTARHPTPA